MSAAGPGAPALGSGRCVRGPDRCSCRGNGAGSDERVRGAIAMGRSGGDRLSRALRHSTIGAGVFNGRVRDGIGFWARRSGHQTGASQFVWDWPSRVLRRRVSSSASMLVAASAAGLLCNRVVWFASLFGCRTSPDTDHESDQANRAISTGRLNASPRLHPRPIDVVVFHGPQGRSRFKGGFPLRCLQRLSRPYIAMLHCRWRDNSSTRGTFIPVLSY